ncbi:NmrA family transcriptional regulator [Actinomadura logoneensis]|uniref:NmrA family transcriptional regulator n=1 Tax=Actinomadura logoneensis TaxID=2293572 RepID=A0A372JC67_9ACTN|nr:NAD(P)H-binding protein [Actinomadura logoneensis]RFU36978.1 NmrA family transcriptional regulator [Actinomadura logoneensis]
MTNTTNTTAATTTVNATDTTAATDTSAETGSTAAGTSGGAPILVLAGTGKTGRRVAERLTALGLPVRIGARSAETPFDWTDRGTWPAALDGVRAVYLAYAPDLAVPGAPEAVTAFCEAAVAAGVRRIVLLSGRGEKEAEECEDVVRASGADWTVVRAAWFAQNFTESDFVGYIRAGHLALPVGEVPEPFVDADDIADVAVAALTEDGHAGEVYEVTGPRALTFAEAMGEISELTGRPVGYSALAPDDFAAALAADGVPAEVGDLLTYLFTTLFDGRNARPADGVRRALGREPRDFRDFVREAAATGVWNT